MSASAVALLYVFMGLAFVDGVVLHLWVFKLHQRAESRLEHGLHTARTFLMVPVIGLLFGAPSAGALLWCGTLAAALDLSLGCWDAFIERSSRARWGGLGRWESALHVALSVLHGAAVALILASRPLEAWSWSAGPWLEGAPHDAGLLRVAVPATAALGVLHLVVLLPPFQRPAGEGAARADQ